MDLSGRKMAAELARAAITLLIAARVVSSESGHRCPYVSRVVLAEACRSRAWMTFTSSPELISSEA
jgi:hypothetical protein